MGESTLFLAADNDSLVELFTRDLGANAFRSRFANRALHHQLTATGAGIGNGTTRGAAVCEVAIAPSRSESALR